MVGMHNILKCCKVVGVLDRVCIVPREDCGDQIHSNGGQRGDSRRNCSRRVDRLRGVPWVGGCRVGSKLWGRDNRYMTFWSGSFNVKNIIA